MKVLVSKKSYKLLPLMAYIIIALGIVLRIVVYLQNRNLIIDEANIARNLYERNFAGLAQPLSYEQYAPPLFLWVEELATRLLGFGEYAMRIYPLLCGIGVLLMMYRLLKQYAYNNAIWYPLLLLATGPVYLRYSTEIKQYMPDALVALMLVYFALQKDIVKMPAFKFSLFWILAGSLAIWLSMPAVFMLTAVGMYYLYIIAKEKTWHKLTSLAIAGVIWAGQFTYYYFTVLQQQATSGYLQNFHKEYFLYALPTSADELLHNWEIVVMKVLGNAAGHWAISIIFHLACIIAGLAYLLRRQTAKAILVAVPILLMLVAAAMQRYSLIPRLTIFAMPLMLVLIGAGLSQLFRTSHRVVHVAYVALAIICINNFNAVGDVVKKRMQYEEMQRNLQFLMQEKISGNQLYIHHLAQPAFTYYTGIHPRHARYNRLQGPHMLKWGTNYATLAKEWPARGALLCGWQPEHEISAQVNTMLDNHVQIERRNDVPGGVTFIMTRK